MSQQEQARVLESEERRGESEEERQGQKQIPCGNGRKKSKSRSRFPSGPFGLAQEEDRKSKGNSSNDNGFGQRE